MLKSKLLTAAVVCIGLVIGTLTNAQADAGVRGIAFCNNGEEIWVDTGFFCSQAEAKFHFDNQVYSVCTYRGGLSFFTRNYYYSKYYYDYTPYWSTPYWSY
ncbi:MAG: hypothetical protein D3909_03215 [Candidatus Electrothrix sp. ATG1]|nr:hypothetical protein [Candidatus Electrothrix sp. ATG1]MCI5210343.1 hypothetical protein [Candidatus Electrothrix sp. ATG2]